MFLFATLMFLCLIAILCASFGVSGKAGFVLGLVMLTLQGLTVVAYTNYTAIRDAGPLSERVLSECEVKDVSEASGTTDDVAAILRSAGWYGIPMDGGERLYSPACVEEGYIP